MHLTGESRIDKRITAPGATASGRLGGCSRLGARVSASIGGIQDSSPPAACAAAPATAPTPTTASRDRRRSTDALTLVITMRIGADLSVGASKQRVEHPCADRRQLRGIRSRRSGAAGKHLRAGVVQLLRLP